MERHHICSRLDEIFYSWKIGVLNESMKGIGLRGVFFWFVFFVASPVVISAKPPSLAVLKRDLARHFLDAGAHMKFAKALLERGMKPSAFSVLEYARTVVFSKKKREFREAHRKVFLDEEQFDNSKKAEKKILAMLGKARKNPKLLLKLADIYISRREWREAEKWLRKLLVVTPLDYSVVEALKEVLYREGRKEEGDDLLRTWFSSHPRAPEALVYKARKLPRGSLGQVSILEKALAQYPKNGWVAFYLGCAVQGKEPSRAEKLFLSAADLEKKEPYLQGWAGRFLLKARKKPGLALKYYYRAYFLNPDFYDTEFAEYRIKRLEDALAREWVQEKKALGWDLGKMVEVGDAFKIVAAAADAWKGMDGKGPGARDVEIAGRLLGHEAPMVQITAVQALCQWNSELVKSEVRKLLKEKDPFRKSLALLPALKWLGKEGLQIGRKRLRSMWDLFWYDAMTGLAELGGKEGSKILEEHMKKENRPFVLDLWKRISSKLKK